MPPQAALAESDLHKRALDRSGAVELCLGLPRQDPMVAQQALCDAVSRPGPAGATEADRLATLIALDGAARQTCERLLDRYVHGDAQLRLFERRAYVSALRLSQSMSDAYDRLLRGVGESSRVSAEQAANIIVRLLAFRQIEFLLRMFRYKKRNASQWRALHETYRSAMERDLQRCGVSLAASDAPSGAATTAEHLYIQILLLEVLNGGQLAPCDSLQAYRWLTRWCRSLCLRPGSNAADASAARHGFAVDPTGSDGPTRKPVAAAGTMLHVDTEPLMATIDAELAFRRQPIAAADELARTTRRAEVALLGKLRHLLAPVPARVERRAERTAAVYTVQVVAGLSHIVHALRRAAPMQPGNAPAGAPLDDSTIEAYRGPTRTRTLAAWDAPEFARGAVPEVWQVRDRSDSGCRMRGKTADLNRVIPGSLVAMRANETTPWTLGVVCRVRRLMVDYVEIGVEYVGRKPRFVKVVMGRASAPSSGPARGAEAKCVGALYLPPSEEHPAMPIRTLLLPAREYRSTGDATLLSSNATYELRLNEPIRRQVEFVWTPFTVTRKIGR